MSDAKSTKVITHEEFKQNISKESLYVLLHNKVYNATQFIDEHPGGEEVILAEAGKDATEAFEDVGHSDEARTVLEGLYVGEFEKDSSLDTKDIPDRVVPNNLNQPESSGIISYLIPAAFLGAYFAWRYYSS